MITFEDDLQRVKAAWYKFPISSRWPASLCEFLGPPQVIIAGLETSQMLDNNLECGPESIGKYSLL